MNRSRRLLLATLALGAASFVSTAPAHAAPTTDDDGGWLTVAGPVPLFDLADLAPGDRGETEISITNEMPAAARFSVRVVDLLSDDFGCNEPESDAGDASCGQDDGELDDALQLTVHEVGSDGSVSAALRTDVLSEWEGVGVEDGSVLGAGAQRTYAISYELPTDTTDTVQSDRVSFALELSLDQATGTEVSGDSFGRGATKTIAAAPELPRTGAGLLGLIRLGAGAIAVGCVTLLIGVRPRPQRPAGSRAR